MRGSLFFLFVCCFSVPALAWQKKSIPIDSIPSEVSPVNKNKNLLAFPFAVRSLETNWGFGAIAARFFKPGKHSDTTVRTSDVNILALYTLRSQLIIVLSSTIFFPGEDRYLPFPGLL